jgi:hypothetical protein
MIHTKAFEQGNSLLLQDECEKLLKALNKEKKNLRAPRLVYNMFIGISGLLLGILLVVYFLFSPLVKADFLLNLKAFGTLFCLTAAFVAAKLTEREFGLYKEVSGDFYAKIIDAAEKLPDIKNTVVGHECLSYRTAAKCLSKLYAKARYEAYFPAKGELNSWLVGRNHLDMEQQSLQRKAFQAVSLPCSPPPPTPEAEKVILG